MLLQSSIVLAALLLGHRADAQRAWEGLAPVCRNYMGATNAYKFVATNETFTTPRRLFYTNIASAAYLDCFSFILTPNHPEEPQCASAVDSLQFYFTTRNGNTNFGLDGIKPYYDLRVDFGHLIGGGVMSASVFNNHYFYGDFYLGQPPGAGLYEGGSFLPPNCNVTVQYSYSLFSSVTPPLGRTNFVPYWKNMTPHVLIKGNSLAFDFMRVNASLPQSGGHDVKDAFVIVPETPNWCDLVDDSYVDESKYNVTYGDRLHPAEGQESHTWQMQMNLQDGLDPGYWWLCVRPAGWSTWFDVGLLDVHGNNPAYFLLPNSTVNSGNEVLAKDVHVMDFYGVGLDLRANADEAKLISVQYECTQSAPAIVAGKDLGPSDLYGKNIRVARWEFSLPPGTHHTHVCYKRSGYDWVQVPFFDQVPPDTAAHIKHLNHLNSGSGSGTSQSWHAAIDSSEQDQLDSTRVETSDLSAYGSSQLAEFEDPILPGGTPMPDSTPMPETPSPETQVPSTEAPDTPTPLTPVPETGAPLTPTPVVPVPPTPSPLTPQPATPVPETPSPSTSAPSTAVPGTPVPETQIPATPSPVTASPQTEVPETPTPATQVPATSTPETSTPPTPTPLTQSPGTAAPGTTAPDTAAPVTSAPKTPEPETQSPQTSVPRTPGPVTAAPVTPGPVTPMPVTPVPETTGPATNAPAVPQSPAPATVAPDTPTPATASPATPVPAVVTPGPATPAPSTSTPSTPGPSVSQLTPTPTTATPMTASPLTAAPVTMGPTTPSSGSADPTPAPESSKCVTGTAPKGFSDENVEIHNYAALVMRSQSVPSDFQQVLARILCIPEGAVVFPSATGSRIRDKQRRQMAMQAYRRQQAKLVNGSYVLHIRVQCSPTMACAGKSKERMLYLVYLLGTPAAAEAANVDTTALGVQGTEHQAARDTIKATDGDDTAKNTAIIAGIIVAAILIIIIAIVVAILVVKKRKERDAYRRHQDFYQEGGDFDQENSRSRAAHDAHEFDDIRQNGGGGGGGSGLTFEVNPNEEMASPDHMIPKPGLMIQAGREEYAGDGTVLELDEVEVVGGDEFDPAKKSAPLPEPSGSRSKEAADVPEDVDLIH